ncbi:hypothetical protein EYV94_15720 [Puteibacter caeruleilacunae]|nr:hypothetical protein EYV94_15720 [Puteibacter caeruleilacunae]
MKIKVAAISMKTEPGDIQKNLDCIRDWIAIGNKQHYNIICFPELCISGYLKDAARLNLIAHQQASVEIDLQEITSNSEALISVGLPELDSEGNLIIAQQLWLQGKKLGTHYKTRLSINEKKIFSEGNKTMVFDTPYGRVGMQLCYESHFPEIASQQADQLADFILMSFASPRETASEKMDRLMRYLPARAYDNSCFVVACNNQAIDSKGNRFPGVSMIIDPKGIVLEEWYGDNNQACVAECDTDEIRRIRNSRMGWFRKDQIQNNSS